MSDDRYDPIYDNEPEMPSHMQGMRLKCCACNEPCVAIYVDNGIGSYEFWGSRGRHVQKDLASDCCESDVQELCSAEDDAMEEQGEVA